MRMLIDTMQELLDAHEALLKLAQEKQEVLIKGDVERLSLLLKEEGRLVKQIGKLESERQFQARDLAVRYHIPQEEDLTLDRLLAKIPEESGKAQVTDLAHKLRDVIGRLKQQNELNMRLTQDALQAVNYSLELLTRAEEEITYSKPTGQAQSTPPSAGRGFFDAKA
jgi:flagellar biosynthesis/type III secretory pathway chaperone